MLYTTSLLADLPVNSVQIWCKYQSRWCIIASTNTVFTKDNGIFWIISVVNFAAAHGHLLDFMQQQIAEVVEEQQELQARHQEQPAQTTR